MKGTALVVQIGDAVMVLGAARPDGQNVVVVGDHLLALEHVERMGSHQRHDARDLGEHEQPDQPRSKATHGERPSHAKLAWPSATSRHHNIEGRACALPNCHTRQFCAAVCCVPAGGGSASYPVLRVCAGAGCGMRMSAPVTRLTSVMESYGKLIAECALRIASSSGPDMKQKALPSSKFTCAA